MGAATKTTSPPRAVAGTRGSAAGNEFLRRNAKTAVSAVAGFTRIELSDEHSEPWPVVSVPVALLTPQLLMPLDNGNYQPDDDDGKLAPSGRDRGIQSRR